MFLTRRRYRSFFLSPPPPFFFLIAVNQPAEHINPQIQAGITGFLDARGSADKLLESLSSNHSLWHMKAVCCLTRLPRRFPTCTRLPLCGAVEAHVQPSVFLLLLLGFFFSFEAGSEWQEVAVPASCRHGKGGLKTNMRKKKKKISVCVVWRGKWGFPGSPFCFRIQSDGGNSFLHPLRGWILAPEVFPCPPQRNPSEEGPDPQPAGCWETETEAN